MKDRLKELRKSLGLTQGEFGKKIGMSDVSISYMESGRTAINNQNVNLICLTFGVRQEWFRTGIGDMLDDEASLTEYERRILNISRQLSPEGRKVFKKLAEDLVEYDEKAIREDAEAAQKGEKPE
jgi:transcriptional regulator with XRE-family HTH domain